MNTNHIATLGTGPLVLFGSNEISQAEFPYVLKIVNHAHAILGSIPFIQVIQPVARKASTAEAVLDPTFHYLLAILDSARNAGFRFETVVTSATRACVLIS